MKKISKNIFLSPATETCQREFKTDVVSGVYLLGEALNNEDITQGDIGVVLDNTDRKLFALRNEIADVQGPLRHYNPALARRVSSTSRDIFQLRNETARFLIRSQGPSPDTANQPGNLELQRTYYYRALDEKGFKARQMQVQVDRELKSVWEELQKTIHSVEKSMAG